MSELFHKASAESEARVLTFVGAAVVTCVAVVAALLIVVPSESRGEDVVEVLIESPYAAQGVQPGAEVLMHGVKVGEVKTVDSLPGGNVRLSTALQRGPTDGLTTAMEFDFRPANYFGVTGISLIPIEGGEALVNGTVINAAPRGNFTLQALLSRLGEVSDSVLTPKLIDVVQRVTTYADELDPLLETFLVVANTFVNVQTVSTAQLLANTTGITVALPGVMDAAISTGDSFTRDSGIAGTSDEFFRQTIIPAIDYTANNLFGALGKLVSSHSPRLAPLTDVIKTLSDIGPGVVPSDAISDRTVELRERLERLFSGPPDRRAVDVRVILETLPGVAAPIAEAGGLP